MFRLESMMATDANSERFPLCSTWQNLRKMFPGSAGEHPIFGSSHLRLSWDGSGDANDDDDDDDVDLDVDDSRS